MNLTIEAKYALTLLFTGILMPVAHLLLPLLPGSGIIAVVFIVVGVDSVLGIWLALRQKRFSASGFGRILGKLVVYFLLILASSAVTKHAIAERPNIMLSWVNDAVYGLILAREMLSILENAAKLGFITVPQWIRDKLEKLPDKN